MPSLPNTDVYKNPDFISDIVREAMVPSLYMLYRIPFTMIDAKSIIAKRKLYTADTEPKKQEPAIASTLETAWPMTGITMGEAVPINTAMRKIGCAFANDDLTNATFEKDARETYTDMAWTIADQVNTDLFTLLKTAGTTPGTTGAVHTSFDAKASGETWDGNCDPIAAIRAIAEDISRQRGYQLDTIVINSTNYYEMFDNIEQPDMDMDYVRDRIASQRQFYEQVTYISNIGVYVIGVPSTSDIPEGGIMGIGSYRGTPCVENFSYYNPLYTRKPIMDAGSVAEQGIEGPSNIPLNVHTWDSQDGFTHNVYAWIDSAAHIPRPLGIFYKSSGI